MRNIDFCLRVRDNVFAKNPLSNPGKPALSNYTQKSKDAQLISNSGELLSDVSAHGKPVPWATKKAQSEAVSLACGLFGNEKYAAKIADCGSYLKFAACSSHDCGYKKLLEAYFCHFPFCPMCQWRRSRLMFHQLSKLIHKQAERYSSDVPLLLTLTVPNASGDELPELVDRMFKGFSKLFKRRMVDRMSRSWFRTLEVTYNAARDDYHPHFHVLLMVPMNYFVTNRNLYITRDEWLRLWQEVMGMPEITQVDIRRVKAKSKRSATNVATAEVAKYATKPGDYVKPVGKNEYLAKPEVIQVLHRALKGRRLVAFGGLFYQLRKELKLEDIEKADLVKVTDEPTLCQCKLCQSELFEEVYRWHVGVRDYVAE